MELCRTLMLWSPTEEFARTAFFLFLSELRAPRFVNRHVDETWLIQALNLVRQGREVNTSNNIRESLIGYTTDQQIPRVCPPGVQSLWTKFLFKIFQQVSQEWKTTIICQHNQSRSSLQRSDAVPTPAGNLYVISAIGLPHTATYLMWEKSEERPKAEKTNLYC